MAVNLAERIPRALQEAGWPVEQLEPDLWQTGFNGEHTSAFIYLRRVEGWLFCILQPYVPAPDPACRGQVLEALMRRNYHFPLVKFCLDEDGEVLLSAELPARGLTEEAIQTALAALALIADREYPVLERLTREPGAPDPLAEEGL